MGELDELAAARNKAQRPAVRSAMPSRSGSPPKWVWVIGVIVILWVIGTIMKAVGPRATESSNPPAAAMSPTAAKKADPAAAAEIRAALDKALKAGAAHSIDYQRGVMRVDPITWAAGDVEAKRRIVLGFQSYYEASGQAREVKVMSSRNDTVLAEYSYFSGVTVHH